MQGVITGISVDRKDKISFIVLLGESDGGLVELEKTQLIRMAKHASIGFNSLADLHMLNGKRCNVNLLREDHRIIEVTGLQ